MVEKLGYVGYPLGIKWLREQPEGYAPDPAKHHDCILKYMRLARKTGKQGWISRANPACRGGSIYAGFNPPNDNIAKYVSLGERYLPTPASMHNFFSDIAVPLRDEDFCVFKPLDQFTDAPELVVFFARGETLSGLCQLACFAFDDHNAVAAPFGSGCANILSWPASYARKGRRQAVLGGMDPSCRPYMDKDELSFAVTLDALDKMLDAARDSFLSGKTWQKVQRKNK